MPSTLPARVGTTRDGINRRIWCVGIPAVAEVVCQIARRVDRARSAISIASAASQRASPDADCGIPVARTIGMRFLDSILVPIDGSAPSLLALEHAIVLADDYTADVVLLHVLRSSTASSNQRDDAESERDVDAAFERARASLGDRVSRRTAIGDPVTEIVEIAREGFDLIIMGTHGRVGRLHSTLGSVAEAVVRNAPCPVLTVRDQTDGYQSFTERRHARDDRPQRPH